jgi:ABC-type multidrug transport system ATPase subunit
LTLSGVTKSFDGRRVLNGLDLAVRSGESVALLGANGSGKTTTLRCIVGLAHPDAGRIEVAGVDGVHRPLDARRRISYLPQTSAFPPTLTVRDTLAFVARVRGVGRREVDREIEACGLTSLGDRNVGQLSGGERQRLAMAAAFLPDVDVYLFDEPSVNLDPLASRLLFQRARQLRRDGRTLLFSTHVPADIRHLASRAVFLRHGRIDAEAAGDLELRRFERMLERDLWGDDDDIPDRDRADAAVRLDRRLHGAGAVA